jgi:hypothetical protein
MRREFSHLPPFISILLLFSTLSFGQAWSGVLAPSRAIDWSHAGLPATLPDGETTTNPWTPPTRSSICQTLSPGVNATQISNAIASCSSAGHGSVVLLNPGTYTLSGGALQLYGDNVTLRGSGPMQTIVKLTSASLQMGAMSQAGNARLTNEAGNFSPGSTSFNINNVSGTLTAGMTVSLYQCDTSNSGYPCSNNAPVDNGSIYVCGFDTNCNIDGSLGSFKRTQQQTLLVTSVVDHGTYKTVSFTPGLYMPNWTYSQSPVIEWNDQNNYGAVGMGLENMTIYTPATGGTVSVSYAYASWVTGVRFVGSRTSNGSAIIEATGNKNVLMANNYLFGLDPASPNYGSYIFVEPARGSDDLYLNNIFQVTAFRGGGFLQGDVLAYNYHRDIQSNTAAGFEEDATFQHQPEAAFVLNEGDQLGQIRDDDTWGTHHFDTFFRNILSCYDTPYLDPNGIMLGIQIGSYARFENAVGNAIGSKVNGSNYGCKGYQSIGNSSVAFIINDGANDALTNNSLMRWGNVTTIAQGTDTPANSGIRFVSTEVPSALGSPNAAYSNPVPGDNNLPASFFMNGVTAHPNGGTGLSWWKVCTSWTVFPNTCAAYTTQPFPAAGPDVTGGPYVNGHAYDIPAALAWKNLPIDASFQNTYNISGSSWSNGIETLTVSIAGGIHIQGGFQITGSCAAGGAEFLMTASSSTTISYALASNPGSCSGGTVKWPDVRQFDESVYQADASAAGSPTPPTGLSASVQ